MEPTHIWMRYEKARALAVDAMRRRRVLGLQRTPTDEDVYDALEMAFLWRSAAEAGNLRNIRPTTREQMIAFTND